MSHEREDGEVQSCARGDNDKDNDGGNDDSVEDGDGDGDNDGMKSIN